MTKTILAITLITAALLSGCKNSMKEARAAEVYARTRRANEIHAAKMKEQRELAPVRLVVKEVMLLTLMGAGVFLLVSSGIGGGYLIIGGSIGLVERVKVHRIKLDPVTFQYDFIAFGPPGNRRFCNPNTGERDLLDNISPADRIRIEASTKVQLAGLLADGSQIING